MPLNAVAHKAALCAAIVVIAMAWQGTAWAQTDTLVLRSEHRFEVSCADNKDVLGEARYSENPFSI